MALAVPMSGQTRELAQTPSAPSKDKEVPLKIEDLIERLVQNAPRIVPLEKVDAVIPNTVNILPKVRPKTTLCAIPLLQIKPDPKTDPTIKLTAPSKVDEKIVAKPTVPSCSNRN